MVENRGVYTLYSTQQPTSYVTCIDEREFSCGKIVCRQITEYHIKLIHDCFRKHSALYVLLMFTLQADLMRFEFPVEQSLYTGCST
jgi:hypothetical protein